MTTNCPTISDTARLSLAQASRLLEIDARSLKKYAGLLGITRTERAVGGFFYYGKDVKRIWTRIA